MKERIQKIFLSFLIVAMLIGAYANSQTVGPQGLYDFGWLNGTNLNVDYIYINNINYTQSLIQAGPSGYDQDLNTTDDVSFSSVNVTSELYYDDENRTDVIANPELPISYIIDIFGVGGTVIRAKNGTTGQIDYQSTDATLVFDYADTALASTGGRIFTKTGNYSGYIDATSKGVVWDGEGITSRIILPDNTNRSVFIVANDEITITNLFIDGNRDYQYPGEGVGNNALMDGIEARTTVYNTTVENVWIAHVYYMGIDTGLGDNPTYYWRINKVTAWDIGANCIAIANTFYAWVSNYDVSFCADVGINTWNSKFIWIWNGRIHDITNQDSPDDANNNALMTVEAGSKYVYWENIEGWNAKRWVLSNDAVSSYWRKMLIHNMTTYAGWFGESGGQSYDILLEDIIFENCTRILETDGVENITIRRCQVRENCELAADAFQLNLNKGVLAEGNFIFGPTLYGFDLHAVNDSTFRNNVYENCPRGISMDHTSNDNLIEHEKFINCAQAIKLVTDCDRNRILYCYFVDSSTCAINVADSLCDDNKIMYNDFYSLSIPLLDSGTNTILHRIGAPFIEGTTFLSTSGAPQGWEIDANTEYAIAFIVMPANVYESFRINVYGYAIAADNEGMTLELQAYAGQSSQQFDAEAITIATWNSTTTAIAADDALYWSATASDDTDIDELAAGDIVQIKVLHEALSGGSIATDAVLTYVEIEYL